MQDVTLTSKQTRFVEEYLVDANGAAAAVRAGYAAGSAKVAASRMLTKDNPVRRAIQARQDADSERLGVSRERVISGLLEAIGEAKTQGNPMAVISGWREVGKMLGFYAAETKRVDLSIGLVAVQADFAAMSDAQLLALVEQGAAA